jgi:FtsP/CotA-like multicopper oxidase with cupredoxin domain
LRWFPETARSCKSKKKRQLPESLSEIGPLRYELADNLSNPKRFFLTMNHMQWSISGRIFQMQDVAEDEIVSLGSTEIWEFNNTGGGMMHMMNMPHPIHLHGKSFRVIERRGTSGSRRMKSALPKSRYWHCQILFFHRFRAYCEDRFPVGNASTLPEPSSPKP